MKAFSSQHKIAKGFYNEKLLKPPGCGVLDFFKYNLDIPVSLQP